MNVLPLLVAGLCLHACGGGGSDDGSSGGSSGGSGGGSGGGGSGGGGSGGGGGGGGGGGSDSVAGKGGILHLAGNQPHANFVHDLQGTGVNYLLWFSESFSVSGIARLQDDFTVDWLRSIPELPGPYTSWSYPSGSSDILFIGETDDYGAGGTDKWYSRMNSSGVLVQNSQRTFGTAYDDSSMGFWPDYSSNSSFTISGSWPPSVQAGELYPAKVVGKHDSTTGNGWVKTIDGFPGYLYTSVSNALDGGLICSGYGTWELAVNLAFLASFSPAGAVRWQVASETSDYYIFAQSLYPTRLANNNLLFGGRSQDSYLDATYGAWVAVYSETQGVQWARELQSGGLSGQSLSQAVQLPGGDVVVAGHAAYGGSDRILLARFTSSGSLVWTRVIGGGDDYALRSVSLLANGRLAIHAKLGDYPNSDDWLAHVSQDGYIQWQRVLDGVSNAQPDFSSGSKTRFTGTMQNGDLFCLVLGSGGQSLVQRRWASSSGYFYSTSNNAEGASLSFGSIVSPFGQGGEDAFVVKWGPDFSLSWSRIYGGSADDSQPYPRLVDNEEIILTGVTTSFTAIGSDPFVIGLDANGETSQTCWMGSDGNPSYSLPVSAGSAVVSTINPTVVPVTFAPVNWVQSGTAYSNPAYHSSPPASGSLSAPCGN